MKIFLKNIIKLIFRYLSYFLPFSFISGLGSLKNYFYTEIVKKTIHKCGDNFIIECPLVLLGGQYITIGNCFRAAKNFRIEAYDYHNNISFYPEIIIGDNVSFGYDCHVGCCNKIIIGNNVLFGSKVYLTDHFHGKTDEESIQLPPNQRNLFSKGEVVIEDNVWIGEGVVILPNVKIGKNSIIGANSVVTKNIPENSVAGGVPAIIIKTI
jgi:acetyltransferase-like isoleucine patch superfamily enzyme